MSTPGSAIRLQDVTCRYGANAAVDGVALSVGKGEVFGLVGPDGAGKTTLIRLLCGLLRPASGRVEVAGCDTVARAADLKRRIGYLSQRFSLYGDLTVEENLDFFARLHAVRGHAPRKEELLAFTRLGPFRDRLADRLSGGMKQKLALACTLIHRPEVIFLDEPTTGVDPVSRRDFWTILNELHGTGITILMATPYLDEAERCSRVALLDHGRVLACDTPRALRSGRRGPMVEVVCDRVREAATAARGVPGVESVQQFGDRIHVGFRGAAPAPEALAETLAAAGVTVRQVRAITPSLEDVFIEMVGTGREA